MVALLHVAFGAGIDIETGLAADTDADSDTYPDAIINISGAVVRR